MICERPGCGKNVFAVGLCLRHLKEKDHQERIEAHMRRIESEQGKIDPREERRQISELLKSTMPAPPKKHNGECPIKPTDCPLTPAAEITEKPTVKPPPVAPPPRKQSVLEQSIYASNGGICRFAGCRGKQKKKRSDGYCPWHRWHDLAGLPLEPRPERTSITDKCHWPGCDKRLSTCGFCASHIGWMRKAEFSIEDDDELSQAIRQKIAADRPAEREPSDIDSVQAPSPRTEKCRVPSCRFPPVESSSILGLCGGCLTSFRKWNNYRFVYGQGSPDASSEQRATFELIQAERKQQNRPLI